MTWSIRTEILELRFSVPFHIARPEASEAFRTLALELDRDGASGLGECYPLTYYGETVDTVAGRAAAARRTRWMDWVRCPTSATPCWPGWNDPRSSWPGRSAATAPPRPAWTSRSTTSPRGRSACPSGSCSARPTGSPRPTTRWASTSPAVVAERALAAAHFPALKIKVGGPADIETLEAVRAVYSGALRVDANTAWQPEQAAALIPELARLGVELIEQPFPARALPELRWLRERSSLPILADESAVFEDDLPMLEGVVDGVVVKLAKCGGIGPGLRMIRRARSLGMSVMLGCMFESSLGTAAGAMVASEVDWLDLDGNLMMVHDPFEGIELGDDCRWQLTSKPGLGIERRPAD